MREPTVRRGRVSRQQRLLRTGIGVVVIIAIAALIANALGGDKNGPKKGEPPIAQVAFHRSVKATSDGKKPKAATVNAEAKTIVEMLNDWYQRGFVDPAQFGNGTFPEIASHFTKDARASFAKDIGSLTIGDARTFVSRVDPTKQNAKITIFFQDGAKPLYAVAAVRFEARATQNKGGQPPITIEQTATLHLEKQSGGWFVSYYSAKSSEEPVVPLASPSGSASQ